MDVSARRGLLHAMERTKKHPARFPPSLSMYEAESSASLLSVLADPIRLSILNLLRRYEGMVCVDDLVGCFSLAQSTISHHLRLLREHDLIESHKRGLTPYYVLKRERWAHLKEATDSIVFCFAPNGRMEERLCTMVHAFFPRSCSASCAS